MKDVIEGEERVVAGYRLACIAPNEFLDAVFDGCGSQNLVGIGSIRPSKKRPTPHLHYLMPIAVADREALLLTVVEASKPASTFFCYNTFAPASCPITRAGKRIVWKGPGTEIYFAAKNTQVEELCATVVDLDVGRTTSNKRGATLTADEALQIVLERCREDRLPPPSLVVFSGRGIQLVYLLREEIAAEMNDDGEWITAETSDRRRPVPRTAQHEQVWKQIADDILKKRLSDLAPDKKASKTTCNWFRVPGTFNEKSGLEVTAWRIGDDVRYYSLDELSAELLRTASGESDHHPLLFREAHEAYSGERSKRRRDPDDGKPRRASTPEQVAHPSVVRVIELEKIARHRGAIGKGHRHSFLYHYRSALCRANYFMHGWQETKRIVAEKIDQILPLFAQPDDDPFGPDQVNAACRANPWLPASNETVADDLDVTWEETEALGLTSIIPHEIAEERKLNRQNAQRQKKLDRELRDLGVKVLLRAGRSYTAIERLTGVKRSTIRNIKQRYEATGELLNTDSPLKAQESHLVAQLMEQYGLVEARHQVLESYSA